MNIDKIEFFRLCEKDLILLHQWFQKEHVLQWYARGVRYTLEMIREKYFPRLDDPDLISYIIHVNDIPVGYIQIYSLDRYLPDGVSGYTHPLFAMYSPQDLAGIDIFIADELYLGKGYGSKVLKSFINTYVKNRYRAVITDPAIENEHAVAFFSNNGFHELEAIKSDKNRLLILEC